MSKGYQAIERFSEDVDLTYDIRAIVPELAPADGEGLPPTRSQEQRWTKTIRERLELWVRDTVSPVLIERLRDKEMAARATVQPHTLQIEYEPHAESSGYVRPVVLLEFGDLDAAAHLPEVTFPEAAPTVMRPERTFWEKATAIHVFCRGGRFRAARSTGEPFERRPVTCDAAAHLPEVTFPEAAPTVMRPERTFWEKATAIHDTFCRGGRFRAAERFSRHWYDIGSLDRAGFVASAIADRGLARRVARHKSIFYRQKDGEGVVIDYEAAGGEPFEIFFLLVRCAQLFFSWSCESQTADGIASDLVLHKFFDRRELQLVPDGAAKETLAADYAGMVTQGLVFETAPDFTTLIAQCRAIQKRANQVS